MEYLILLIETILGPIDIVGGVVGMLIAIVVGVGKIWRLLREKLTSRDPEPDPPPPTGEPVVPPDWGSAISYKGEPFVVRGFQIAPV